MSDLKQLKLSINLIGSSAKRTATELTRFKSVFSNQVNEVQRAIGGSTQGKDRDVIEALNDARRKVDAAADALDRAAKIAQGYGTSL